MLKLNILVFLSIMKNREKFLKIYANVPLGVRREIILTLDDQPITWNVAYIEVYNNTKLGDVILHKLHKLEIL
jgi:hypothetical protein